MAAVRQGYLVSRYTRGGTEGITLRTGVYVRNWCPGGIRTCDSLSSWLMPNEPDDALESTLPASSQRVAHATPGLTSALNGGLQEAWSTGV